MKNSILLLIMLITISVTAQKKKGIANDCYMSNAVSTFDLSEEGEAKLNDALIKRLKAKRVVTKNVRTNEITKEEAKVKAKAINQNYFKMVMEITGKSKKEVMAFEKETKQKCNKK